MAARFITFLTDFGLQDDFVGVCHGVIKQIAPDVEIIDVTHGITRQNMLQGALTLANVMPYLPIGVHLAVVDPGVGGTRRAIALEAADGRMYVGPDNGLLIPAAERMGGVVRAHSLTNRAYALAEVSPTFHARDVFSPAAAHLALGVPIEEFGEALPIADLVRLDLPQPEVRKGRVHAVVIDWDRFGNIQLNLRREHIDGVGIEPGGRVELEHAGERYYAVAARTFADARPGDIILFEDSYDNIAVAISGGNAAELLGAVVGDQINVVPLLG
jgi:S-adenosyl-L-methionine hydrolase (adenosine-forming)